MEQTFIKKAEKEAQEKAIKQIASMLSRADQLDKVEQYQRRIARKKVSLIFLCPMSVFINQKFC